MNGPEVLILCGGKGTRSYPFTQYFPKVMMPINGTPAGQLQIDYVILENGSEIWGLPLNSGGVLACTLRRMDREPS